MGDEPKADGLAQVFDLPSGGRFRQLVALIADGVVIVDAHGKISFVNPAAEELLGRRGRDLVGSYFGFPLVAGDATEIEIVRPDRELVVVELRCAELEWDGEPAAVASLRDVTERWQTVEQQEHMIDRLRELDRLKTEFVSMVSHDLRSPMATIAGFADTLRLNWDAFTDDHKREILERISRSTSHLSRLVENVLQVSQIESGKLTYDIQAMDIVQLVYRVVGENTQPIHGVTAGSKIDVSVPDLVPLVRGDEIRQWQIITNLVTNALKFSAEGESVEIQVTPKSTHVHISVTDHGPGIKPEDMDKLFKKFIRLEQPEGMKVKGTGLGLYICKSMVEAQGGEIWVESQPGAGSTFTYTVPIVS